MRRTRADIDRTFLAKLVAQQLKFGDPEQNRILRDWRAAIAEFDELERLRNDPDAPLREWRVGYSYRVEEEEIVEATCEQEARRILRDDLLEDFEIEYVEQHNLPVKKLEKIEEEDSLWQSQISS